MEHAQPLGDRRSTSLSLSLITPAKQGRATEDIGPFSKYQWVEIVKVILEAVEAMRTGTYEPAGKIAPSGYTMIGQTERATEATSNNGLGNPIKAGIGLVRSTFRPSDDATIFQFLIPSNMVFARTLETASETMQYLGTQRADALVSQMRTMAAEIREGIAKYAIVSHPLLGAIYAYEVDGYGIHLSMDDANLPSLLSIPLMPFPSTSFVNAAREEVYVNTRRFVLSTEKVYWMHGNVMSGVGGPHDGPEKA